jgi:hypothetical protein
MNLVNISHIIKIIQRNKIYHQTQKKGKNMQNKPKKVNRNQTKKNNYFLLNRQLFLLKLKYNLNHLKKSKLKNL